MIKQSLRGFLTLALFVLLAVASAYGETVSNIAMKIPFDFILNNKTLPAGEYIIEFLPHISGGLWIRTEDGHVSELFITRPVPSRQTEDEGKLVFHRYGRRYFLAQVWAPESRTGYELAT